MFKSFSFHDNSRFYKVIDDDFVVVSLIQPYSHGIYSVVISIYSRRELPVIPNLLRLLLFMEAKYSSKTGRRLSEFLASACHDPMMCHYRDALEQEIQKIMLLR